MRLNIYIAALSTFLATAVHAQDFQGTWQGHILFPQRDVHYVLQIDKRVEGTWDANVVLDEDWGIISHASAVSVEGRAIEISGITMGSTYNGQLSADGHSLSGTWTVGKQVFALNLERATPATLWREAPHKTEFVTVDKNVRLEVLDWGGTGRPVVLFAGLGGTAHVFGRLAAKLTSNYHVYGITRRGFGASSRPEPPQPAITQVGTNSFEVRPVPHNPYDADQLGDDGLKILHSLKIVRPVLIGHSVAGEELSSIGSRYPKRVAGLIYLDAFYDYAYSDGKSYDTLFTTQHPLRQTLPPGKRPQATVATAVMIGTHEYRSLSVPALAICAVPQPPPPGVTDPSAIAAFDAYENRAVARLDRIAPLLPTVRFVRIPSSHYIFESKEPEVLHEITAFIGTLPR